MDQRDLNNLLPRLQRWYLAQCDGDWEHDSGVHIQTLDNPGWLVKVNLLKTSLAQTAFKPIREGTDAKGWTLSPEWIHCFVVDGVWQGAGDGSKLARILEEFLSWAERTASGKSPNP
jgi:hypothetical protein